MRINNRFAIQIQPWGGHPGRRLVVSADKTVAVFTAKSTPMTGLTQNKIPLAGGI